MGQEVLNIHSGIPWHSRYPSGVMLYPLIAEVSVVSFPLRCLSKQRFESTEFSPAQMYGSRAWSLRSSTHPLFVCTLLTCLCLFFQKKKSPLHPVLELQTKDNCATVPWKHFDSYSDKVTRHGVQIICQLRTNCARLQWVMGHLKYPNRSHCAWSFCSLSWRCKTKTATVCKWLVTSLKNITVISQTVLCVYVVVVVVIVVVAVVVVLSFSTPKTHIWIPRNRSVLFR